MSEVTRISGAKANGLPDSYDGLVAEWKSTEREVETRLWRMTEIASSLCGNFDADSVKMFARQVHYSPERIYELARAWQLRASMPEHRDAVGEWMPGRYLSVTHFVHASYFPDPQKEIREAVRDGISSSKLYAKRNAVLKPSQKRLAPAADVERTGKENEAEEPNESFSPRIELWLVELGDNLRELRVRRNLTQDEARRAAGVTKSQLAEMENGMCCPSLRQLARLCGIYETTMDMVAGHMVPVTGVPGKDAF